MASSGRLDTLVISGGCTLVENVPEFEKWLLNCIEDGKTKLGMTDETLAYLLLREGINLYLKTITKSRLLEIKF